LIIKFIAESFLFCAERIGTQEINKKQKSTVDFFINNSLINIEAVFASLLSKYYTIINGKKTQNKNENFLPRTSASKGKERR
jgi:hypothetical protein